MEKLSDFFRSYARRLIKLGKFIQGKQAYTEKLLPQTTLINYCGKTPEILNPAFVSFSSSIIGSVKADENCSIWSYVVIRGDDAPITIGSNTHLLDNVIVHISDIKDVVPTKIGMPQSIVHACTVGDNCYISNKCILLDKSIMENDSVLLPNSVLTQNKIVKEGEIWGGSPARFIRKISDEEKLNIKLTLAEIENLSKVHNLEFNLSAQEIVDQEKYYDYLKYDANYVTTRVHKKHPDRRGALYDRYPEEMNNPRKKENSHLPIQIELEHMKPEEMEELLKKYKNSDN